MSGLERCFVFVPWVFLIPCFVCLLFICNQNMNGKMGTCINAQANQQQEVKAFEKFTKTKINGTTSGFKDKSERFFQCEKYGEKDDRNHSTSYFDRTVARKRKDHKGIEDKLTRKIDQNSQSTKFTNRK